MADKYINATKLIERLKEERTHSLASEAWNPALVGTMLELKTKHILGEIISVMEENLQRMWCRVRPRTGRFVRTAVSRWCTAERKRPGILSGSGIAARIAITKMLQEG